jgi:hypothetical protein
LFWVAAEMLRIFAGNSQNLAISRRTLLLLSRPIDQSGLGCPFKNLHMGIQRVTETALALTLEERTLASTLRFVLAPGWDMLLRSMTSRPRVSMRLHGTRSRRGAAEARCESWRRETKLSRSA